MEANPLRAAVARSELQIGTWINLIRNPGKWVSPSRTLAQLVASGTESSKHPVAGVDYPRTFQEFRGAVFRRDGVPGVSPSASLIITNNDPVLALRGYVSEGDTHFPRY